MENNQLYHHGVVGMKWGVRRYQNKDGSLTAAGKKRVSSGKKSTGLKKKTSLFKKKATPEKTVEKPKSVKDMTDEELRSKIARMELEKRYDTLNPKRVSAGRKILDDVIIPVAKDSSKRLLTDLAIDQGKKLLGLNGDDSLAALEKSVKKLELERKYQRYTQNQP